MQQQTKVLLTFGGGALVLLAAALFVLKDVRLELKFADAPTSLNVGGARAIQTFVGLSPDGGISVGGAETTLEQLPDAVDRAYRLAGGTLPRARQTIIISAGPDVTYGNVLAVWTRLEDAGWSRVARVDPSDDGADD